MSDIEINSLQWQKMEGLLPAIIQHAETGQVLMLGYMNREALLATITSGQLTLFSRTRQKLWRKGERSGTTMALHQISADCDNDSLLVQVLPKDPTNHKGYISRYQPPLNSAIGFLGELIDAINKRAEEPHEKSLTTQLLEAGVQSCAQKLGEEALATAIAAINGDQESLIGESADLMYHLLVLLKAAELSFYDIGRCLKEREMVH
jgi:phosphoribosyl-ATP pyrophosphohydrolase/phosphoribosyl-AMP cyclohydrolase